MKKIYLLALFCLTGLLAVAQSVLTDASYATDFTLYEIDKTSGQILSNNPYTLYQYTDSGKTVYLDFFATWCNPCWSYHTSGAFEDLYAAHGPSGTNDIMTMGIEGDDGNYAALSGTGPDAGGYASQGNWLSGVEYPIFPTKMSPNTTAAVSAYNITYFPTVYMVCPTRIVYEIGQQTAVVLYSAKSYFCPQYDETVAVNGALAQFSIYNEIGGIDDAYLCTANATPKVVLHNVGQNDITSAEFTITFDGQTSTYNWTGNLSRYQNTKVSMPQITTSTHGSHTYTVELTKTNGMLETDATNNTRTFTFNVSADVQTEDLDEDFASGIKFPWFNPDGDLSEYQGSVYYYTPSYSSGAAAALYAPIVDVSGMAHPVLKFDLAHKQRSSAKKDRLQVQVSGNCGSSWSTLYNVVDPDLATVSGYASSQAYVPSASHWRTETVDLASVSNPQQVALRFRFVSGNGNLVWVDNVRIVDGTDVEEHDARSISLFPNPTSDVLNVNTPDVISEILVYNIEGQLVRTLKGDNHMVSLTGLANGIYTLKIMTEKGMTIQKVVKQ